MSARSKLLRAVTDVGAAAIRDFGGEGTTDPATLVALVAAELFGVGLRMCRIVGVERDTIDAVMRKVTDGVYAEPTEDQILAKAIRGGGPDA